jgi:hypothetical protein
MINITPHTAETKLKMSLARKGRPLPEGTKRSGKDNPFYGKHHSEESKQKLREAALGRKLSEETKLKMRGRVAWNKGRKNPEHSKCLRQKYKNGWAPRKKAA